MTMGRFDVVCGPMWAGKTETIIARVRRAYHAGQGVQVFRPSTDTRRSLEELTSHAETKMGYHGVVCITPPGEPFAKRARPHTRFVALEEAQFFGDNVVGEVQELLRRGISVLAAGLDRDYMGRPFGPMPALMAHADSVTKLTAICSECKSEKGTMTFRHAVSKGVQQILVGAEETYKPLCRECWETATYSKSQISPRTGPVVVK